MTTIPTCKATAPRVSRRKFWQIDKLMVDMFKSILPDKARLEDDWSHNWLTVEQLTRFDRSAMTYEIINRQCPESYWDKYHQRTKLSNRRTWNCRDLQIPINNPEYVKKGFPYSGLKAWNDIPTNVRELLHITRFKK